MFDHKKTLRKLVEGHAAIPNSVPIRNSCEATPFQQRFVRDRDHAIHLQVLLT